MQNPHILASNQKLCHQYIVVACCYILVLLPSGLNAQSIEALADYNAAYKRAFATLMLDPSKPEHSFQFAKQAIRAGDLQGAITAFERILKINPNLDNIKLELGVLYLRVGANELSTKYLSEALASPEIPLPVKSRGQSILKQAQEAASPHNIFFRVGAGSQYDDNATSSPTSEDVFVNGQPALLDEASSGQSDTAVVLNTSAQYVYSFDSQIGNQLEAGLTYAQRNYDESDEIDSDYAALQIGPRFYFGELLNPSWSLKPFFRLSQLDLEGQRYQRTLDYGIDLAKIFSLTQMVRGTLAYSENRFENSETRRSASERDGNDISIDVSYLKNFRSDVQGFIGAGIAQRSASVDYEERDSWHVRTGLSKSYKAPFNLPQRWNSSVSLVYSDIQYDAPDPAVDPNRTREEQRWQINWNNTLVFNSYLYSTISLYHTDNESSLPNYQYDNAGINMTLWVNF